MLFCLPPPIHGAKRTGCIFFPSLLLALLVVLQCKFVSGDHHLIHPQSALQPTHEGKPHVQKDKTIYFFWKFHCSQAWMMLLRLPGVFFFRIFWYCFFLPGSGNLFCGGSSQDGFMQMGSADPAGAVGRGAQLQASKQNCSRERGSNSVFCSLSLLRR